MQSCRPFILLLLVFGLTAACGPAASPLPIENKSGASTPPASIVKATQKPNRYGILPAVCGADKAASYIGREADAALRKTVTTLVGHKNIRWTLPGQAEIENFLPERLNMLLDKAGRIQKVDCY